MPVKGKGKQVAKPSPPQIKELPKRRLSRVIAQRRLQHLSLDDFDELFRFRLGNKRRLWGILDGDVFYPLWWDADHKVYPLEPE